jgi:hypothetical protein
MGKECQYPLDRRLGRPQSWCGHRLEEKPFAPAGNRTPVVLSVFKHYMTELPQLLAYYKLYTTSTSTHVKIDKFL